MSEEKQEFTLATLLIAIILIVAFLFLIAIIILWLFIGLFLWFNSLMLDQGADEGLAPLVALVLTVYIFKGISSNTTIRNYIKEKKDGKRKISKKKK